MEARLSANTNGFTLIELILVVVLAAIIGAGLGEVFLTTARTYVSTENRKSALQDARWAMDRMIREIRLVIDNSSVNVATDTTFTFVDVNGNPVSFSYDPAARQITRNAAVLASNVDVFDFDYLDDTGLSLPSCPPPPCAAPTPIWRIRVNAETAVAGERVLLQTGVHPRNF